MPPEQGSSSHGAVVTDRVASSLGEDTSVPQKSLPCFCGGAISTVNMKRESERLKSYKNWPLSFLLPEQLAKAGFYYTNEDDRVRCPFCGIEVGVWEEGDDPFEDHKKWSSSCDFVQNIPCGNIPISDSGSETEDNSYDTCGPFGMEIRPFSGPEKGSSLAVHVSSELEKLGITKTPGPHSPNYSTYESRLATYKNWPAEIAQSPMSLAEAGFYYIGDKDCTKCFYCSGGLTHWEEHDDPWVEHARWFSRCGFVLLNKGKDFVASVTEKKPAVMTSQAVRELEKPGQLKNHANESSQKSSSVIETKETGKSPERTSQRNSSQLCKICYEEELGVVFLPCGHIISCVKCAPSLSHCAVCREPLKAFVRAFIS